MDLTLKIPLESFVRLYSQMNHLEYRNFVKHSLQVAKMTKHMVELLKLDTDLECAYLAGLLHDIGLALKASIENYELFVDMFRRVPDLEKIVLTFDKHDQHAALSYMIARYAKPLCPYCAKSILYHHTPYQEIMEDKTIVIFSNVLKMADTISLIVLRNEDEELTLELFQRIIDSILKNTTVLDDVKKAAFHMVQDYKILCELLDDEPRFSSQRIIDSLEFEHLARILASLLDMRSPYTRNHTFLAARFAKAVAKELLAEEDSNFINLAMLLHDIGKLKTPLSVLHKPARLNEKELYIMKMHVVDTYRMLENAGLINFAKVSASHHERLDGSGYPMGLKAEKISIYQRIAQVCDVFSALIEHRPYREAMNVEQALEVVSKEVEEGKLDKTVYEKLRELVKNESFHERGIFQNVLESILNVSYEEIKEKIKVSPFEEG